LELVAGINIRLYGGIKMNIEDIKELVKLIDSSKLTEFQYEKHDVKITMKKEVLVNHIKVGSTNELPLYNEYMIKDEKTNETNENVKVEEVKVDENLHIVKSPILGTFYATPSPDAQPYVKVGDKVKKGDVLCIVEAMKLMNEINSDEDGEIVEILIENQNIVEYGQPLFKIRKV
jgi:acetyl-CoA carboxylase biotin carboxyl carrier protein